MKMNCIKEFGMSLFAIVISVCLYIMCALQFINREVSLKFLFLLMSIWSMTVLLTGLIIEIVRTEVRGRIDIARAENGRVIETEDGEIWIYILGRTVCCVSLILTCIMTALTVVAYLILEAERRYISLGMGLATLPVIITVIKLWRITKKEITFSEISF